MSETMAPKQPTAAMLVIGDEILSGRTRDANAHHLACVLSEIGLDLQEIRVVSDDHAKIVAAVRALSGAHDHLFTSGGIGPTHDDITADAVADAMGAAIGVRDDARQILEAWYGEGGINEARMRMARIPEGAILIDNPVSRAPGFTLGNVHVMAGVPVIFQEMLAGLQTKLTGGPKRIAWSFRATVPEGDLAEALGGIDQKFPSVSIGSYPFFRGGLGTMLVLRSIHTEDLAVAAGEIRALLDARGANGGETPPGSGESASGER